jgi:C-terminal processing protease CtpA/Prc
MGWSMKPAPPHLSGKIFFLTDGSAISYAESYMGFIRDFHLATIVGQPTAGTNGNINPFTLPGGYRISWTGMLVKDHNGGKHHLKGITPDVPVQRTITGIREGRDEFLEKAIGLAGK